MSENETQTPAAPLSRTEIVHQIGQILQERRSLRGLTIEKVAQHLKIRIPYLQALERGEWDQLPGEVYVRGFLRRYLQFLGLDVDKVMAPYLGSSAGATLASPLEREKPVTTDPTRFIWAWVAVIAVFLIVLIKLFLQESKSLAKAAVPATAAVATPAPAVSAAVSENAPTEAPPVFSWHTLEIFSPTQLWVGVAAQDRTYEGFIPQGSTWTWKGSGRFSIRLGHSNELRISFDGAPVVLLPNQKRLTLPNEN